MSASPLQTFLANEHSKESNLYLLLDPLGGCPDGDPLHIGQLRRLLGEEAMVRVPRPDLKHAPDACPTLVTLSGPTTEPSAELLALTEHRVEHDRRHSRHYICGWLSSSASAQEVGEHLVTFGRSFSQQGQTFLPLYQPLRLELLRVWFKHGDQGLWPVRGWLFPGSEGHITARGEAHLSMTIAPAALEAQLELPLIAELLEIWRDSLQSPPASMHRFSWRQPVPRGDWAFQAYQQIRQARAFGLKHPADINTLAIHCLLIHSQLPSHPDIQQLVAQAAAGTHPLETALARLSDDHWQQILTDLQKGVQR